jgi:hypothetical protein
MIWEGDEGRVDEEDEWRVLVGLEEEVLYFNS